MESVVIKHANVLAQETVHFRSGILVTYVIAIGYQPTRTVRSQGHRCINRAMSVSCWKTSNDG